MARKSKINNLKITKQEVDSLLSCPKEVRYKYTLKRIADTETLWTIGFDNGAILIQDDCDKHFFLVWSSKEFADDFISNLKGNHEVIPMALHDFLGKEQNIISQMNCMINIFPTKTEFLGMTVNLERFTADLNVYLKDFGEYIETDD